MIFTIPNLVSVTRIGAVPVMLWLLLGRDDPAAAGWLLGAIAATDWIDGYLARKLDQVSELGKMLDPVADRLAVVAAVIGGWIAGALPWPVALAILVREAIVSLGALILVARTKQTLDVRYLGKMATMAVYVSVPNFMVFEGTGHAFFGWAAWVFGIPGLILYYWVMAHYLGDIRRTLGADVSSPEPSIGDEK